MTVPGQGCVCTLCLLRVGVSGPVVSDSTRSGGCTVVMAGRWYMDVVVVGETVH